MKRCYMPNHTIVLTWNIQITVAWRWVDMLLMFLYSSQPQLWNSRYQPTCLSECLSLEQYCMYCRLIFYIDVSAHTISLKICTFKHTTFYNFTNRFYFIYEYHSAVLTYVDAAIYIFYEYIILKNCAPISAQRKHIWDFGINLSRARGLTL